MVPQSGIAPFTVTTGDTKCAISSFIGSNDVLFCRQKLNPNPRPRPTKGAIQYGNYFKALGWNSGTSKEVVERKIRDMTFMRKVYAKNQLGVSTRKNLLQMKHFRRQVDF